jgi:hypothetical protein
MEENESLDQTSDSVVVVNWTAVTASHFYQRD